VQLEQLAHFVAVKVNDALAAACFSWIVPLLTGLASVGLGLAVSLNTTLYVSKLHHERVLTPSPTGTK
jgi:hypothetical protein